MIRRSYPLTSVPLAAGALLLISSAQAAETPGSHPYGFYLERLTTTPEDDLQPALSPDGKWLVYKTMATGLGDLTLLNLQEETLLDRRALHPHPAADSEPRFTPDGSAVIWKSYRGDIYGDYWGFRFPDGNAVRLTAGVQEEQFIGFETNEGSLKLKLETRSASGTPGTETLPLQKLLNLSNTKAPVDASVTIMPMVLDDTNNDGILSLERGDAPSLCVMDGSLVLNQLTPPLPVVGDISIAGDSVVFSARFGGQADVFRHRNPFPVGSKDLEESLTRLQSNPSLNDQEILLFAAQVRNALREVYPSPRAIEGYVQLMESYRRMQRPQRLRLEVTREHDRLRDLFPELTPTWDRWQAVAESETNGEQSLPTFRRLESEARNRGDMAEVARLLREQALLHQQQGRLLESKSAYSRALELAEIPPQLRNTLRWELLKFTTSIAPDDAAVLFEELMQAPVEELPEARFQLLESWLNALPMANAPAPEQLPELRLLRGRSVSPYVVLHTKLKEAQLLVDAGNASEALQVLGAISLDESLDPLYQQNLQVAVGELELRLGRDEEALRRFRNLFLAYPEPRWSDNRARYLELREEYLTTALAEANRSLRLGDAPLALIQFRTILELLPNSVEAVRGVVDSEFRTGRLTLERLKEYRALQRGDDPTGLYAYQYGLALSYSKPTASRTRNLLELAIRRNSSIPYYYQTLGFVVEAKARETASNQLFLEALDLYQRALVLLPKAQRINDYARLLQNAGNTAFEIENMTLALEYFRERESLGVPFDDPRSRFLFHRNYGIAAYRSLEPEAAVEQMKQAQVELQNLVTLNLMQPEEAATIRRELLEREGLAELNRQRHVQAAALFRIVAEELEGNTLARARAHRNWGYSLFLEARRTSTARRFALAEEAVGILRQSLAIMEAKDFVAPRQKSRGLLGLSFNVGSNTQSQAQVDLTPENERRFVRLMISRVVAEFESPTKALEELQQQRTLLEKSRNTRSPQDALSLVQTLDEMATLHLLQENHSAAMECLIAGFQASNFQSPTGTVVLVNPTRHFLLRMGELWLAFSGKLQGSGDASRFTLTPNSSVPFASQLIGAMESFVQIPVYQAELAAGEPSDSIAHVQLMQALLAEHLSLQSTDDNASVGLALKADRLAQRVLESGREELASPRHKRWMLAAYGVTIRTAERFEIQQELQLEQALLFARQQGFDDWSWWLILQSLKSTSDTEKRDRLSTEFLAALRDTLLTSEHAAFLSAMPVVEEQVVALMQGHAQAGRFSELVEAAETLRLAEMRFQYGRLDFLRGNAPQAEEEWYTDWRQYRRGLLQARQALTNRNAATAFTQERADRLLAASDYLKSHLETGAQNAFPVALRFTTMPLGANPAQALQDFNLTSRVPVYVVALPNQFVLFTPETEPALYSTAEALQQVLPAESNVYVANFTGSSVPLSSALHVSSLNHTLLALSQTPLRVAQEETLLQPGMTMDQIRESLLKTDRARVDAPLSLDAASYTRWYWNEKPFEAFLPALELSREWEFSSVTGEPEAFAGFLATNAVASVGINGSPWLSQLLTPEDVPDLAASELDAEMGRVVNLIQQGRTREAIGPLRRVWLLRQALGASTAELLEAGRLLAQTSSEIGNSSDALPIHEQLIALLESQEPVPVEELAFQYRLLGADANQVREWNLAATSYVKASALFGDSSMVDESHDALRRAAAVRENQGNLPEAFRLQNQLLAMDGLAPELRWQLHSDQGRIELRQLNRFDRALESYTKAVALAEEMGDTRKLFLSRLDVVRAKERLGMIGEASDEALAVLQEARDSGNLIAECDALLVFTFLEWTKGQYLNAFNYQTKAATLADTLGDTTFQTIALNYRGLIHWALNDTPNALNTYERALERAEELFFEQDVASTLNNRSLVYRSNGDYALALEDLNRAFEIDRRWNNTWALAYNHRNRGITYLLSDNPNAALSDLNSALPLTREIGDPVNEAKTLLALGDTHLALLRTDEAQTHFQQAREIASSVPLPEVEWRALHGLSECARLGNNVADQEQYLQQAIAIVDNLRAALKLAEFQDGFLVDKQSLYDDLLLLRLNQGNWVGAYEVSEQARGRNFVDLLGSAKIDLFSGADDTDLRREEQLRSRVDILERQLSSDDPALVARVATQLTEARRSYSDFLLELRARNPELTGMIRVEPLTLGQIQELLDAETALLQYHVTEEELIIFLVTQNSIRAVRRPVSREALGTQILALRERLQNVGDVETLQAVLSAELIQPLAEDLRPLKRLGIIPHRELHLMPFAVLQLGDGLLLESHSLFFGPSGAVLRHTMQKQPSGNANVLALGNPDLGNVAFNLPMAEKEARRVAWTFPEATILTGEAATKSWLVSNIANYGIIHLASHGEYQPAAPLLSGLQLAPDSENSGVLTAAEIFGLDLQADLIALSACQTGLGRITGGDEIIGLNRSFVYAGTRQVLSSLWRVDDVSTSILIKHFYRNMGETNRAEALRQAQLTTMQQYPHPTYWAGITLSGDWE
jgi:CHAT domain-containing protein